jgi:hypothetical protein
MLPGFQDALSQKYDILGRNADANMIAARGQAALSNANAGQVAANAESQRNLQKSQAGLTGAQTSKTTAEAGQVDPLAQSTIGLQGHQGSYFDNTGSAALMHGNAALIGANSQSDLVHEGQIPNYQADTNRTQMQTNQQFAPYTGGDDVINSIGSQLGFHAGTTDVHRPLADEELHMIHQHLCMGGMVHAMGGMSQVPGQPTPAAQVGTQASDQVPAMLAPNEAVLNEHAADIIGRDKIAAANAIGNHMAKQQREHAAPAPTGAQARAQPGKAAPGKGMPAPKEKAAPAPEMSHQKLSGGTHQVAHGKSAKTPGKIDPAAAMALLQMAQGGGKGMPAPQPGGMPAPNGSPPQGNPMPMQPSP